MNGEIKVKLLYCCYYCFILFTILFTGHFYFNTTIIHALFKKCPTNYIYLYYILNVHLRINALYVRCNKKISSEYSSYRALDIDIPEIIFKL